MIIQIGIRLSRCKVKVSLKMGNEIDLLAKYPKTKRDLKSRAAEKTENDRRLARQFGQDFFDGDRRHGYGGLNYDPKYWGAVVRDIIDFYSLGPGSKILDVGCAKGFMLVDLLSALPEAQVTGIDVSEYAISHAHESIVDFVQVGDARSIPFPDNSFDLVISINTIHNLVRDDLIKSLQEITRVSTGAAFITVDAFRNDLEKQAMFAWNLTAETILSVSEWEKLFIEAKYDGDYYWFIP